MTPYVNLLVTEPAQGHVSLFLQPLSSQSVQLDRATPATNHRWRLLWCCVAVRAFWFRMFFKSLAIVCASCLCSARSSLFLFNCELMSGPSEPDAARNCDKNALPSGDELVDPDDAPPGDAATSGLEATAASGDAGALVEDAILDLRQSVGYGRCLGYSYCCNGFCSSRSSGSR